MGMETLIPVGMSLLGNLAKSGDQGAPQQQAPQAQQGPQGWSMLQPPTGSPLSAQQNKSTGIFDLLNQAGPSNSMVGADPLGMGGIGLLKSIFGMK